ncbi:MAG: amidohydrolase family protein [Acidobacteria bacterium]|nr:amidohydrolase family protein [Acidobacteriota bacterium]
MKIQLLFSRFLVFFCISSGWGQQGDTAAKLGAYPQMIVFNAKIVTMNDASFTSQVGTIVQAMAIRDSNIVVIGTNAEVRALAGPQTKQIDLRGRTVLPSFMLTHEHPTDWAFQQPRSLIHVLPNDDFLIHRWMPSVPPREQLAKFEPMMREALGKAKPGQPILLSFNWGPDYEWAVEMGESFRKSIRKEYLDQLAPNNPVKVKGGFITSVVNQMAMDKLKEVHPTLEVINEREKEGYGFLRQMEPDAFFRGRTDLLAQVLKAEMEYWASYGVTTFGSSPYTFHNYQALSYLDKRGEMPGRFAWGYSGPDFSLERLRFFAGSLGHGTDHLWLIGAWDTHNAGSGCVTIKQQPEWTGQEDTCSFAPGSPGRENLERIVESGMRVATMHTGGDKDIDYFMDAIEQASRRAGLTPEQIREKRHAFDHSSLAPRLEQISRIKNLGMMVSQINTTLWEPHRGASVTARRYGREYTSWVVPRKLLNDNQVMNTSEIDRPLPYKTFFLILKGMNRYHDYDQVVYGPDQRTDRIAQLKALTRWGGYYVLRENLMGTLEPGKFSDFIVLDKDFLTVPEEQIPTIQVLMTVVGGKTVHLTPELARQVGMNPVGPTTWSEKARAPEGWGPPPPLACSHSCKDVQ